MNKCLLFVLLFLSLPSVFCLNVHACQIQSPNVSALCRMVIGASTVYFGAKFVQEVLQPIWLKKVCNHVLGKQKYPNFEERLAVALFAASAAIITLGLSANVLFSPSWETHLPVFASVVGTLSVLIFRSRHEGCAF